MGKKSSTWLNAVKKAFSHTSSKDSTSEEPRPLNIQATSSHYFVLTDGKKDVTALQEKKSFKEKNRWSFRRSSRSLQPADQFQFPPGHDPSHPVQLRNTVACGSPVSSGPTHYDRNYGHSQHQNKHAVAVAVATAAAAEAAVAAAQAAAHVAKLSGNGCTGHNGMITTPRSSNFSRRSKEEHAAIRIQSAFRAFLARRTLRTLKGLARLQSLAQGRVGQRQTTATMRCMQALVRTQAAVRGRRTESLLEDSDTAGAAALILNPTWERWEQSPLASEKGEKDRNDPNRQRDPEWDYSTQTIEQIRARELSKQEAAVKRERSMAYAFSHQQLNSMSHPYGSKANAKTPQSAWNWLERWMAAKPWENRHPAPSKEAATRAATPASTPPPHSSFLYGQPSPRRRGSAPATPGPPSFRQSTTPRTASPTRRTAAVTPLLSSFSGPATSRLTTVPLYSASTRAHSIASSLRDDLSVASFSGTPSYMATTESARAKLRSHSTPKQRPSGARSAATSIHSDDVRSAGQQPPARKRLSFINGADKGGSARHFLSWRGSSPAPLQRNFSFEGRYSKTKF